MADDDDPAIDALRAAWRSLPDEDPPERGIAELMVAARAQAEVMAAARTPWWKRVLAGALRPPMLALASVLVLLGGLFAVTSSHKGVSPEPTPMDQAPAAAGSAAAAPAPVAAPAPTAAPTPAIGHAAAASFGAASSGGGYTNAAPAEAPVTTAAPVEHKKSAPAKPVAPKKAELDRANKRDADEPAAAAPPAPAPAAAPAQTQSAPAPVAAPAQTQSAPSAAAALDDGDDNDVQGTRGPMLKAKTAERSLDDELAACHAAAVRGDCATVRAHAKQIQARDAHYYTARVAGDAAIAKCLP